MSSQPPESGEPEPPATTEAEPILKGAKEAADERAATTNREAQAKAPWWKFWAKR